MAKFRTFRTEDYSAVCDFLIALNTNRSHIHWNWARFEWMYEHPDFDKSLMHTIGLWFDGDRVVGTAIYDMYFGEAFCAALPEYDAFYPEILDYAYAALKDDSGLSIAISDDNAFEIEAAVKAGFSPIEQTETIMRRSLADIAPAALPYGLQFKEFDLPEDADVMQWAIFRGFDHGDDRAEFERTKIKDGTVRMHFNPQLSIGAIDKAGEPAGYCCLWYDPHTDYAYVEPVCTVPEWRKKGVGKALVTEAMRRAYALGAASAYVISDQAFYKQLGFAFDRRFTFYHKP